MDPFANGQVYEQQNNQSGESWWFKWLIKSAAVILGFIAFLLGLVTAISISLYCILAGFILM